MREKLATLSVATLKEFAKEQGLKVTGLRKSEIIDLLCEAAERRPENKPQEIHSRAAKPIESVIEADEARKAAAEARQAAAAEARQGQNTSYGQSDRPRQSSGVSGGRSGSQHGTYQQGQSGMRRSGNHQQDHQQRDNSQRSRRPRTSQGQTYQQSGYQSGHQQTSGNGGSGFGSGSGSFGSGGSGASGSTDEQARQGRTVNPEEMKEIPLDSRTGRPVVSLNTGAQSPEISALDSGLEANGILEVMPEGFGFIRCENFLPGENDVYVAPSQIRRFNLKTGDIIRGNRRVKTAAERFAALLYITSVNGYPAIEAERRPAFEDLTPIFPNERIQLENGDNSPLPLRVMDLLAPIGKGQRGMIVSPPKAGKTTLLKQVAKSIIRDKSMYLIILLIDERPEEVTDIKEDVVGENVEVIYSTFDELPERHKRVSEMTIERARRLVEYGKDVTILLDSITRLARAYNLVVPPSGRTLSGGLDPAALHMPKRFFGAARNMREGGSLTILATALINTGSRMDDVIYEEFKGTGNMELVLDRKLSEKRIFPAIDILKSGTRRDDLLLSSEEMAAVNRVRNAFGSLKPEEAAEKVLDLFTKTRNNVEFLRLAEKIRFY